MVRDHHPEIEPLRYSLRSCARFLTPLGQLWLVSGSPLPFSKVHWIPFPDATPNRHVNTALKTAAACACPDVADPFLLMNADFIALHPVDLREFRSPATEPWVLARGKISSYRRALVRTVHYLSEQRPDRKVIMFDLHTPILIWKKKFLDVLHKTPWLAPREEDGLLWRTVYGNLAELEYEFYPEDVKLYQVREPKPYPWLSFTPTVFQSLKPWLAALFPDPSPWEDSGPHEGGTPSLR